MSNKKGCFFSIGKNDDSGTALAEPENALQLWPHASTGAKKAVEEL
jgi:hypothetical protein